MEYLTAPSGENYAAIADWAETLVLQAEGRTISTAMVSRLLRGEGSDAAEEELELDAEAEDEAAGTELPMEDDGRGELEIRVEELLAEIELRRGLGSTVYPFTTIDDRIVLVDDVPGAKAYTFLLALSSEYASFRGDRRAKNVEAEFDEICLAAAKVFLGRNASGVRFARNSHDAGDRGTRPTNFVEAIHWLRELLRLPPGEREPVEESETEHWEDKESEDAEPRLLNSYNDGGVDVVAWWHFKDGRVGSPVLLAQCTVQLKWERKTSDIKVELWKKWIDFSTVPPQTALMIPFAIERDHGLWDNRTLEAGVIIDRHRLIELLDELDDDALTGLVDEATGSWATDELSSSLPPMH